MKLFDVWLVFESWGGYHQRAMQEAYLIVTCLSLCPGSLSCFSKYEPLQGSFLQMFPALQTCDDEYLSFCVCRLSLSPVLQPESFEGSAFCGDEDYFAALSYNYTSVCPTTIQHGQSCLSCLSCLSFKLCF